MTELIVVAVSPGPRRDWASSSNRSGSVRVAARSGGGGVVSESVLRDNVNVLWAVLLRGYTPASGSGLVIVIVVVVMVMVMYPG